MSDKTEYFKVRLQHAIEYTQSASRQIYLVSGGLIAGLYFLIEKPIDWLPDRYAQSGVLIVLAIVNAIHSMILIAQGVWYRNIDALFAEAAQAKKPEGLPYIRTHALYALIHGVVVIGSIVGAVTLLNHPISTREKTASPKDRLR
jgi:hypothetical protein